MSVPVVNATFGFHVSRHFEFVKQNFQKNFKASTPVRNLEMNAMMSTTDLVDVNPEEYKKVRVPSDKESKKSLILVKIYKVS